MYFTPPLYYLRFLTTATLIAVTGFFFTAFGSTNSRNKILVLHLKPMYDSNRKAASMHVSYEVVFEDSLRSHKLNLHLDLMENLGRKDDQISDLLVQDDNGVVSMSPPEKHPNENAMLFSATRAVTGKVTVEYIIRAASRDRKAGSYIDMQKSGGGLTGSFISILLFPPFTNNLFVRLDWDLAAGNTAVSSFGAGNVTSQTTLSYETLQYVQFIVGPLQMYPTPLPDKGFRVAGLGIDPEKIGAALPKYKTVYEYLRKQFGASPDLAFRFFFRSYAEVKFPSGSAVQGNGYGSFLLCIPPSEKLVDNDDMLSLVSHEMLHVFMTGINSEWYSEGIAEYLSTILPYQGKFYSEEFYLKSINEKAAQYYTNSIRMLPDPTDGKLKFSTANSWTLPYTRGFLYFANLDAKLKIFVKEKKVTVLSLALELERLKKNQKITEMTWTELLEKKAGHWAVEDWKAMKAGKLITPYPGVFGKKFVAERIKVGVFDLGFNKSRGITKGQIIADLVEGSNAELAGIRNGDAILEFVDLYNYYGSYDKILTVKIKRNEEILSFSFSPRRGGVEGYKWVLARDK